VKKVNLGLSVFAATILVVASIGIITTTATLQSAYAQALSNRRNVPGLGAPMAVSGNNVYVTWWSNKTGD
jgi:hypothetical protein